MAKVAIIKGVEVKVGDQVAVTQWLTSIYTVVAIPRANKVILQHDNLGTLEVCKNRRGGWGRRDEHVRGYGIRLNPNIDQTMADEMNARIEQSETWMCM